MPTTSGRLHYTYPEYLALEEESPIRHEFRDGEIHEIAGGSPDQAALAAAVIGAISAQLPPGCRTFTTDLRVRVPSTGLSTYPDAAVVCGRTQRAADDPLAVVNPVLLIEVTSPSTEDYDRGEKLRHYKHLTSLREVLFVSHHEPRLTVHRRDESGTWTALEASAGESLPLESISTHLSVDVIYQGGLEDTAQH